MSVFGTTCPSGLSYSPRVGIETVALLQYDTSASAWNRSSRLPYRESQSAAGNTFTLRGFNRQEILAAREPLDGDLDTVIRRMVGEAIRGKRRDVVKHDVIGGVGNTRGDDRRKYGCFAILIDAEKCRRSICASNLSSCGWNDGCDIPERVSRRGAHCRRYRKHDP